MKHTVLGLLALAVVLLAGCQVTPPSVKVEPPKVEIPGVIIEGGGNGTHCPPGQAKKGNC